VLSLFQPCAKLYSQLLALPPERHAEADVSQRLAQCEGELAWLVYIIGTVLGSHLTPSSNSEVSRKFSTCPTNLLLAWGWGEKG
jgi:hypothetical protein